MFKQIKQIHVLMKCRRIERWRKRKVKWNKTLPKLDSRSYAHVQFTPTKEQNSVQKMIPLSAEITMIESRHEESIFEQVRHKLVCTVTRDGLKLEMLQWERTGTVQSVRRNKRADQLRGYCEADLRLCFRMSRVLVFSWYGSKLFIHLKRTFKVFIIE